MDISGYRAMWLLVMFDLPTKTKPQRKAASGFRNELLKDGFSMVQYSVYTRPCPTEENAEVHEERILKTLPQLGQVRIIKFTDKQYSRMGNYHGSNPAAIESQPAQISMF